MKTIFVSSTFSDMHGERDLIRNHVAPLVNDTARRFLDEVSFCDLRWGINTEDLATEESSKKVLKVCLDEIDRTEPPFLILLGDRYGWVPDRGIIQEESQSRQWELADLEKSITALEIEYGCFQKKRKTFVYCRKLSGAQLPVIYQSENEHAKQKLQELKDRLSQCSDCSIRSYDAHWEDGKIRNEDLHRLGQIMVEDLTNFFQPVWQEQAKLTPFQKECGIHWRYVEEKSRFFAARKEDFKKIHSLIQNETPLIVVSGDSGSGKSVLFAQLAKTVKEEGYEILPLACGQTSQSMTASSILCQIIWYMETQLTPEGHRCINYSDAISADGTKRYEVEELLTYLEELETQYKNAGRKLLLMIDAVDQLLPDAYRDQMVFCLRKNDSAIRYFLTMTEDVAIDGGTMYFLNPLTKADIDETIRCSCENAGRELSAKVIERIYSCKGAGSPLYIQLLLQSLLLFQQKDFQKINAAGGDQMEAITNYQLQKIEDSPENLEDLSASVFIDIANLIDSLQNGYVLMYIAVSRLGLRISDLAYLMENNSKRAWIPLHFSLFMNFLGDYFLQREDGRIDFLHKCFREGICRKLKGDRKHYHQRLTLLLHGLWQEDPIRINEILYHTVAGEDLAYFQSYLSTCTLGTKHDMDKIQASVRGVLANEDGQLSHFLDQELDFLEESNSYMHALWFLVAYLAGALADRNNQKRTLIAENLLKKAQRILEKKKESMSEESFDRFETMIRRRLNYCYALADPSLNHRTAEQKYISVQNAEKVLEDVRKNIDPDSLEGKTDLLNAIYEALFIMVNDPNSQERAIALIEEGDRLLDKTLTDYLEENNSEKVGWFYGKAAELYALAGQIDEMGYFYLKDLQARERLYRLHPTKENMYSLGGAYFNASMVYAKDGSVDSAFNAYDLAKKGMKMRNQACALGAVDYLSRPEQLWAKFQRYLQLAGETSGLSAEQCCKEWEENIQMVIWELERERRLAYRYGKFKWIFEQFLEIQNFRFTFGMSEEMLTFLKDTLHQWKREDLEQMTNFKENSWCILIAVMTSIILLRCLIYEKGAMIDEIFDDQASRIPKLLNQVDENQSIPEIEGTIAGFSLWAGSNQRKEKKLTMVQYLRTIFEELQEQRSRILSGTMSLQSQKKIEEDYETLLTAYLKLHQDTGFCLKDSSKKQVSLYIEQALDTYADTITEGNVIAILPTGRGLFTKSGKKGILLAKDRFFFSDVKGGLRYQKLRKVERSGPSSLTFFMADRIEPITVDLGEHRDTIFELLSELL